MKTLRGLSDSGKGIVTVIHDLPLAFEFSDEIVVINNGTVIAQTTPSELCDSSVIKDVFGVCLKHIKEEEKFYYSAQI
jgi:iron complex transport system ATP-binding protein